MKTGVTMESRPKLRAWRQAPPSETSPDLPRPTGDLARYLAEAERAPEAHFARNSHSFSFAARLFPADARRSVTRLYAFCRTTDDLVDRGLRGEASADELDTWEDLARRAHAGQTTGIGFLDEIMGQSAEAGVPFELIAELIAGVRSDMGPVELQTFEELRHYCYRVASAIGIWMTRLFGQRDPWLLERAEMLGYALQLTNILRDVGEDLAMDRVYLPREALERHGLSRRDLEAMAAGAPISAAYRQLIDEMMDTAEGCYALAFEAMPHLPAFYARPVAAAAEIYRGILREIRRNDYDNLRRRAVTSDVAKPYLAARGLVRLWWPGRPARAHAAESVSLPLRAFTGSR